MKPLGSVLSAGFCACLLFVTSQASRANVIQPTSTLPPTVGGYVFPTFCATAPHGLSACVENGFISGFFGLTTTYVTTPSVAEEVDGKASFTADLFNDVGGTPGTIFLGSLSGPADIGFSFGGRTPTIQTGTFPSTITEFDFTGSLTLMGTTHTLHGILAPSPPNPASTGTTTVTQVGDFFEVSSFFDVFTELSIDGGPFGQPVEHVVTLVAPEPSPILLLLTGLAGVTLASRLRRSSKNK